ncbi:cbb3-type cytochrome c oxidase subunit I [Bacillus marinisedimentorum]|uniref:cbb3-type cytochrome c oxidase subunit I n=1 Tax=Bacillus marinisedimentorum TaxID=1821260 RepID=UPI000872970F|nr:cbb3-type cytochrome c oxidase subunit I [Bacillus marinisedimentorum]
MFINEKYSAAKYWLISAVVWILIGMSLGLLTATKQIDPDLLNNRWTTYGHIRSAHVMLVIYAWLSMAYVGSMFYMIPKLAKTNVYSEKLGNFTCLLYNIVILQGFFALLFGQTSVIEYGEFPLWVDVQLLIVIGLVAYNLFKTVGNRQEKVLYVSLWYFLGSLLWLPLTWIVGNLPPQWIPNGVQQGLMGWFLGHNAIGLWMTTVGVGQIYYLLPKLTGKPLYSHQLSMIGFWTIATFYVWNGPHHLMNGPIPSWVSKAGIIPSILLLIPVWAVLANFWGTMRGAWHKVRTDVPLKFVVAGSIFYLWACIQGPLQALPSVSSVIKFTHWTVGHAHMGPFGAFSFTSFAAIYYIIPRIINQKIWSNRLMEAHFWFSTIGFLIFSFSLWTAGLIQGFAWIEGVPFLETVLMVEPLVIGRALGGTMMLLGQFAFGYNIYVTFKNKRKMNLPSTKDDAVTA